MYIWRLVICKLLTTEHKEPLCPLVGGLSLLPEEPAFDRDNTRLRTLDTKFLSLVFGPYPFFAYVCWIAVGDTTPGGRNGMTIDCIYNMVSTRLHLINSRVRPVVKFQRFNTRDMRAEMPMYAATVYANECAQIDADPLGIIGATVSTSSITEIGPITNPK